MYSSMMVIQHRKESGKITGTHQQLDKIARKILDKNLPKKTYFPAIDDILQFEGIKGPDGLKRKSPGVDEPMHFIIPGHDDGKLIGYLSDHQYNLKKALKDGNEVRAAFEAAWLAHVITDGLTPAHHFPLEQVQKELMTEKEFVKIFNIPIKGIMRGQNHAETLRNNWLYWGANGYMSKHIAFEYGVAITVTALPARHITPKMKKSDFENIDLKKEFYQSLDKITALDMYTRFCKDGWTTELAMETKTILLPEIISMIAKGWRSCL